MARNRRPSAPRTERSLVALLSIALLVVLLLLLLATFFVHDRIASIELEASQAIAAANARERALSAAAADAAAAAAEALAVAEARASSPDEARRVAHRAFEAAEAWRQDQVHVIYSNMSDADWDSAARWKSYARPDAPERSCAIDASPRVLADIKLLQHAASKLPAALNRSRSVYLALHAFHTTGLEGNTLTFPETLLTIAGQPLFAGFDARVQPSRTADRSATEALNVAQLWDALGLASREASKLDLGIITVETLVDMNSVITRGTDTPFGLRRRAVAIGHQRVLLPMPDEVPVLVQEYIEWLNTAVRELDTTGLLERNDTAPEFIERVLALACDAHTRFVFIHPFSDGNGRLARTLAALVLQRFGLPAPMIPRTLRTEYMAAVSAATAELSYAPLAAIFATSVQRSIACQVQLANEPLEQPGAALRMSESERHVAMTDRAALDEAIARAGCLLPNLKD